MAYIDQVKIGSTTYEIHDRRLENPVDFRGVINSTTTSLVAVAGDTDQWKVGAEGYVVFNPSVAATSASYNFVFTTSTPSPTTGWSSSKVYSGDLVYAYQGATYWLCEVVPSADNPHTHSIPALSGTAANAGKHSHSVTASGTLNSTGAHTHTVNVSASVTAGNGHSHTYSVPTQADSAGGHRHTVTVSSTVTTGVYASGIHSVRWNNTGSASFTGENHSHSVTASGTIGEAASHSHSFTGTADNTGYATPTGSADSQGAHSHTFTGSAVNSSETGSHSHTVTVSTTKLTGSAISGSVLDLTAVLVGASATSTATGAHSHSVTASGTLDSKGAHTHTITMASHRHSFTPAGTLALAGAHSHTFSGSAVNTGNAKQGGSVAITWADYYATITQIAATVDTTGAHTHALSGTSSNKNTGTAAVTISVSATVDSAGGHSHTFTGSSVNTSEVASHSHSVTTTANTTGTGS